MTANVASTMYEVALDEAWDLFADHLSGTREGTFLVLSARPLADAGQTACRKTAAALDYGTQGALFASLLPTASATEESQVDQPAPLDPKSLFVLVEGLDPLCLVCADRASAEALSACYRLPVALDTRGSLFGRPFVAFDDFEKLMETDQGKQEAWALLRKLPKFGDR